MVHVRKGTETKQQERLNSEWARDVSQLSCCCCCWWWWRWRMMTVSIARTGRRAAYVNGQGWMHEDLVALTLGRTQRPTHQTGRFLADFSSGLHRRGLPIRQSSATVITATGSSPARWPTPQHVITLADYQTPAQDTFLYSYLLSVHRCFLTTTPRRVCFTQGLFNCLQKLMTILTI